MMGVHGLVLAAGASKRMGEPKPLQLRAGRTWLEHSVAALRPHCEQIWVAVGAKRRVIMEKHTHLEVNWIEVHDWANGMGQSLATSFLALETSEAEACLVIPCDLPELPETVLAQLFQPVLSHEAKVSACKYDGVLGIPVCVGREAFPKFQTLSGDQGARAWLREHRDEIFTVPWQGGACDQDRPL